MSLVDIRDNINSEIDDESKIREECIRNWKSNFNKQRALAWIERIGYVRLDFLSQNKDIKNTQMLLNKKSISDKYLEFLDKRMKEFDKEWDNKFQCEFETFINICNH